MAAQIATVGTAAIQAGQAIAQIAAGTASGFATASYVGAIVGAAYSIYSVFADSSTSSADTAVLLQIKNLSLQIARLQQDMDAQFAKVDAALNSIFTTLNTDFALIDYHLGVLNGNVHAIQDGLLDVQSQLNQLEQYTLAYSQAVSKGTLISQMNGCLNYAAVHNGADIGNPLYTSCENDFYSWAHDNAEDQLWAGLQQADYSDGNIYNTFLNLPLSVNVNYLAQFPGQNLGLSALSGARLPNPNEWTLGARAYLELAHEWPLYASRINSSRIDDLIQIGTDLQQAAQNINSTRPSTGPISQNRTVFNGLTAKYNSSVSELQSAIQNFAGNFVKDPSLKLGNTLTLWGGPGQSNSYIPAAFSAGNIPACNGSGSYFMPANLVSVVSPLVRTAEQLGVGAVALCLNFSVAWAGTAYDKGPVNVPEFYNMYTYQIQVRVGGNLLYSNSVYGLAPAPDTTSQGTFCSDEIWVTGACSDEYGYYFQSYTITESPAGSRCQTLSSATGSTPASTFWNLSGGFAQFVSQHGGLYLCATGGPLEQYFVNSSVETYDPTSALKALSAQITNVLQVDQQSLYGQIAADLKTANALTGTKLLVQAFVNFGLPNSLQTNDTLHGLLYGSQSILDDSAVQSDFLGFSKSSIPDTTHNKITDEISAINTRLNALSTSITGALNQVQQSQIPESLSQVDLMLEDLQSFKALKNAGALSPCTFQISSGFAVLSSAGGAATVGVQVPTGCTWRTTTGASWLTVISGQSGSGDGTISYSVAANTSSSPRDAIFIIGDQVFRVMQSGQAATNPNCTYAIDHSLQNFASLGGSDTLFISAGPGCAWTVMPSSSWISITNALSGSGSGAVTYSVSANSATQSRVGTITVASQMLTIDQVEAEADCPLGLSYANQPYMATGGSDTVAVSARSGCSWTATSNASWITISSGVSGTGNGTLQYTVSPNTTAQPRTETIIVGSQTETVTQMGIGLRFVPVSPCRVADTRNATGPFGGPSLSGNTSRDFVIPNSSCSIPATAQAYAVNVTVVPNGSLGYVTVWPTGEPQPLVSNLNSLDGRVKANAAIVPAGVDGGITVFATNNTDVVLDINGYFVPATTSAALAFYPLTPCRVADTRLQLGLLGQPFLTAGQARNFPILLSTCAVPATAQAYSLNFTVVPKISLGYLSVWPTGEAQPLVSTLNDTTGTIVANAAIVPAGANGDISVYATNDTDVIIDINGYFAPPQSGGLSFYDLTPCRVLDTRNGKFPQPFSGTLHAAILNGSGSACAVPAQAQSYVFSATVVPPTGLGFLALWPNGTAQPVVSTLNAVDAAITSNMAIVPTTNGSVDAFAANLTNLILDLFGYFAP